MGVPDDMAALVSELSDTHTTVTAVHVLLSSAREECFMVRVLALLMLPAFTGQARAELRSMVVVTDGSTSS